MKLTESRVALVTNAADFAGPPAVAALLDGGFRVFAHDITFGDRGTWERFLHGRDDLHPVSDDSPDVVITRVFEQANTLDAIVSNDHFPAASHLPDSAPMDALRANYEKLVEFPFGIVQKALPFLRRQERANIVMITSNRMRLPLSGGAFPSRCIKTRRLQFFFLYFIKSITDHDGSPLRALGELCRCSRYK